MYSPSQAAQEQPINTVVTRRSASFPHLSFLSSTLSHSSQRITAPYLKMTSNLGRLAQAWPRAVLSLMSFAWALLAATFLWQRAAMNGGPSGKAWWMK